MSLLVLERRKETSLCLRTAEAVKLSQRLVIKQGIFL